MPNKEISFVEKGHVTKVVKSGNFVTITTHIESGGNKRWIVLTKGEASQLAAALKGLENED